MIPVRVPNRGRKCSRCEQVFHSGDIYHSTLIDPEERLDYCEKCRGESKGVAEWQGKIPEKPKKVEPKTRDERAMSWFQKALSQGEEEEAYILSLYLLRRKKLRLRAQKEISQQMELGDSGVLVTVPTPNLKDLAVDQLQAKIAEKLQASVEE